MPLASLNPAGKTNQVRQHGAMEFSDPPVDLDKVRLERLARFRKKMAEHEVAGLLLFNQINTRYATDATNMQIWCSHYETRCVFVSLEVPWFFRYATTLILRRTCPPSMTTGCFLPFISSAWVTVEKNSSSNLPHRYQT